MIELLNIDCMEYMRGVPDKHFQLAICDPPYGIKEHGVGINRHRGGNVFTEFKSKGWDNKIPDSVYFNELKRVSENQIIFGGNYFVEHLQPTMGWIFWNKLIGGDFSDGELAYTSFQRALKMFTKSPEKNYATNRFSAKKHQRIHPCQKPVPLYKWILKNYAKEGDKIFDSHGGSMSIAIACDQMNFDLTLCEIDKDYYDAGVRRFENHKKQLTIF